MSAIQRKSAELHRTGFRGRLILCEIEKLIEASERPFPILSRSVRQLTAFQRRLEGAVQSI